MNGFLLIVLLFVFFLISGMILIFQVGESQSEKSNHETTVSRSLSNLDDEDEIISLAEESESNKNWSQAKKAWSRLIDNDPENEDAYFRRGLVAYRSGDYNQAIQDFEHVIEEKSDYPSELYLHTARALKKLDRLGEAYNFYNKYEASDEPGPMVIKETADLARTLEKWGEARKFYQRLSDKADTSLATSARLNLVEIDLERDLMDRARDEISKLTELHENERLSDQQALRFWYLKAQLLYSENETVKADALIRKIYQKDPTYRDVEEMVEKQISNLDEESIVKKFQKMDQDQFKDFCQCIVDGMGFEVIESTYENPEELYVKARDQTMSMQANTYLYTFKQWSENAGEIAIKEFEFKVVEDRHDKGFFVNPSGYKITAQNYARESESLILIGSEEVLDYFRDWFLSKS